MKYNMPKNFPEIKTAIILAGGSGKRLFDVFSGPPDGLSRQGFNPATMHKSMIPVGGKPILEHILIWLKKWGVKKAIVGVGYQKESIIRYFKDGKNWDIEIKYVEHNPEGGTADALKEDLRKSKLKEKYFFAMNSDQFTSFPLRKLVETHFNSKTSQPIVTIGLVYPTLPFGKITWDKKTGRILNFQEKPSVKIPINAGIYFCSQEIMPYLKGDLEKYTFPVLTKEGEIKGYLYEGFWDTINTIKDWQRVNDKFQKYAQK